MGDDLSHHVLRLRRRRQSHRRDCPGGAKDAGGSGDGCTVVDPTYTTAYQYNKLNQKTAEVDPLVWTTPDAGGAPEQIAPTTYYGYDADGNLQYVTDPRGDYNVDNSGEAGPGDPNYTTTYVYDALNRKIEEIDPPVLTTPDAGGTPQPITPITYYGYDPAGNLKYVTDPRGAGNVVVGGGNGANIIDPNYTTWYFYDAFDRQTCVVDALAGLTASQGTASQPPTLSANAKTTGYDPVGNITGVTNADDKITTYTYNALNEKTAETDPAIVTAKDNGTSATIYPTTYYGYDAAGNVTYVTDPRGAINAGGQGNGTFTVDPNYTTFYTYDALDRKIQETDPPVYMTLDNGRLSLSAITPITYYGYDADGNLQHVTDPRGAQNAGGQGNGTTIIDPNYITFYTYDALNRKIQETDPPVLTAMDNSGVQQSITPTTYYGYDADGSLKYQTDPRGAQNAGGQGNGTTIIDPTYTTWYFYDPLDRRSCVVDALAGLAASIGLKSQPPGSLTDATTSVYDAAGNVSTVTDPDGNETTYQYNAMNEKIAQIDPQVSTLPGGGTFATPISPTTYYGYDVAGNLKYVTDPRGASNAGGQGNGINSIDTTYTTWYFYDALNRQICVVDALAGLTVAAGTADQPPALPVGASTPFDATTTTYYPMGNVWTVTDPDGNETTYQYNALNEKIAEIDPAVYITLPGGASRRRRSRPPPTTAMTWPAISST